MKKRKPIIFTLIITIIFFTEIFPTEKGIITGNGVRLREKPYGKIITKLYKNNSVIVLERSKEKSTIKGYTAHWYKIKTDKNEEGWIFGQYLSFTNSNETSQFLITKDSVGPVKIGMKFSEVLKFFKDYDIDQNNYRTLIKKNNEELLIFYDKNGDAPPEVVQGIIIYSDKYKTKNGMYAGMTIKQLTKIYKNIKLYIPDNPDYGAQEVFFPPDYQTKGNPYKIVFSLGISSTDNDLLGKNYKQSPEKSGEFLYTQEFRLNGKVEFIDIYKW